MPRISLYRENHSNDYRFQDRRISELFTISGVGINLHKYIGTYAQINTGDATQPTYANNTERNIQDLLFLENRDRKYDKSIYNIRGHYTIQDNDFNLSQFGLFLTNDTIYITFHLNDMVSRIGRKIMAGDVFELPHLKDYWPLDDSIPMALKKFYVVQETSRAAEGFAQTWWPHLWRCKCVPMVDGQEYRDILDAAADDTGLNSSTDGSTIRDSVSAYAMNLMINEAVVAQAEATVPKSGYDVANLFVLPTTTTNVGQTSPVTADNTAMLASQDNITADIMLSTPTKGVDGWLTGDTYAPNNLPVTADVSFPANAQTGQYVLRLDYFPNRLFRYDGQTWVAVQDAQRQPMTGDKNTSQLGTFINNTARTRVAGNTYIDQRQTLSNLLRPVADKIG